MLTPQGAGEALVGTMPPGGNLPPGLYTCARCHMVPSPEVMPRDRWPAALTRMNEIIRQYQLGEALSEADLARVIEYYTSRAGVAMPMLPVESGPVDRPALIAWEQAPFGFQEQPVRGAPFGPVIAGVTITDLDGDGRPDVLISDAKNNVVTWIHQSGQEWREVVLASVAAPARTAVADLDGDGDLDIVVASLGSLRPSDDPVGSVVILVNEGAAGFRPVVVLRDEPRVCDVRLADIDGDGALDIVFASFGLYHTGRAGWLRRTGVFEYEARTILRSNGVSHVPTGDVTGDGVPDVVVLVSQEHEKVMLYEGLGGGRFDERMLWRAPHPMWGFSSAELVDLDQDGDLDVVLTNGDALDGEPYSKPWHGVAWLENRSGADGVEFKHRRIGGFHGAYWAGVADFDGDGDLDLIVTSMMNQWQDTRRQAVVWFENDGREGFTLRPVSIGPTFQVIGAVGDIDGDGLPDAVTGGMYVFPPFYRLSRGHLFMPRPVGGVSGSAGDAASPSGEGSPVPPGSP